MATLPLLSLLTFPGLLRFIWWIPPSMTEMPYSAVCVLTCNWVYLRLQPYRQSPVSKTHFPKLAPHYYRPYNVLAQVGKVTYTLQLPPTSRIHPTFYVSLLKPKIGPHVTPSRTLPPFNYAGQILWTLEKVLQ